MPLDKAQKAKGGLQKQGGEAATEQQDQTSVEGSLKHLNTPAPEMSEQPTLSVTEPVLLMELRTLVLEKLQVQTVSVHNF